MNLKELNKKFGTQNKCIAHLEKIRWGKKPTCVHCGSENVSKRPETIKWHCNSCKKDGSVLIGTIFNETRLELPKFFEIAFLMNNAKMGISASEISRNVGVKYHTSWYACHRIRCAMIDNELKLEGIVEFDESYFGGKPRKYKIPDNKPSIGGDEITTKRGRGTKKTPVVGAVERKGRVYVKIIEKLTGRNLLAMLKDKVNTSDSVVVTDDFRSYKQFDNAVEHITIKHKDGFGEGLRTINTIEGFWSIMKNGIKGNYRALSKKYLPFYLAEYSYKYNNRHIQQDSFLKLLENTVKDDNCFVNYKPKCEPKEIVYGKRNCKTKSKEYP